MSSPTTSILPSGWSKLSLRETARPGRDGFFDGDWIEAPYITGAGIRLIQTGNVGIGTYLDKPSNARFISEQTFKSLGCSWVYPGDVLICRLADPVGRACVVPEHVGHSVTSVDCAVYRADPEKVWPRYMLQLLNSERSLRRVQDVTAGSTRQRVSRSALGSLLYPIPPLVEQRRIAVILDALDDQIYAVERIIAKLKVLSFGYSEDAFSGSLTKEWAFEPLGELIDHLIDYRGRTPRKLGMQWGGGEILALSANNVQTGGINTAKEAYFGSEGLYARWMTNGATKMGDILMTLEAPLGNVAQVPDNSRYILSQRVVLLRFDERRMLNEFAYWYLRSQRFQSELVRNSTGTTASGIRRASLEKIRLPIPTVGEQKVFAEVLSTFESSIAAEQRVLAKLKLQKVGLASDLLTGAIRATAEEAS